MNFAKGFLLFIVVLAVFAGQTEAGWLKKIGKRLERTGQNLRDASIKTIAIAQQAADVAATLKG
ncbi:cecropin-1-like [Episyrphus balteatus]|uniref:cecropin-1-like n=1 Tax=Episyrphus balteatus TaxID=286459 RepID=UPI0024860BB7|nr:cecropin-1-like [Episyrphus balteatus]